MSAQQWAACAERCPWSAAGRVRANEHHTHTFPLDQFHVAIETSNERRDGALKVIIEPWRLTRIRPEHHSNLQA